MSPRDRDEYEPKHPAPRRARTGPVVPDDQDDELEDGVPDEEIEGETSSAIADPASRKKFREDKPIEDRVTRLEEKHDSLAEVVHDLRGGVRTLVRQGARRERREVEESTLRLQLADKAAERRSRWWVKFFGFVIALVAGIATLIGAYKAGSASAPIAPAPGSEVRR